MGAARLVVIVIEKGTMKTSSSECCRDSCVMVQPLCAAAAANGK